MPAPLLIADVPWLLYRSFFALPRSIVGADEQPVGALLGTVNALLAVLDARPARAVVACIGAEQAAYRVRLYPRYHAHRDPMPPQLAAQWRRAPQLLESFGWTVSVTEELEADDLMYSFALSEQERGGAALLLTGDRDLFGAVSDSTAVVEPSKGARVATVGPEQVRARYGIDPALVPDFIALRGDPSDGLPGAPGIGAKTAAQLLRAHGSLEAVLRAARRVRTGAGARAQAAGESAMRARTAAVLCEQADQLAAFKRIATLQRVAVEPPADRATDFAGGARAARELGMPRLAERLARMTAT